MKRFAALARVSSREQQREGFSLDIQVEELHRWAAANGGEIVHMVKIAETASKREERHGFKALLAYCRTNAKKLDGLLVYKLDRAARNLPDYVDLQKLEELGVLLHATSQPTANTPAGRFARGMMATMASYQTDQQSCDVVDGHKRRVSEGLFVTRPPYGYRSQRIDGRSRVYIDDVDVAGDGLGGAAGNVRRIFELYATAGVTIDGVLLQLAAEGRTFRGAAFGRNKVWEILTDRSYIGEVKYRGQWHPGKQQHLVDASTWERVRGLMDRHIYHAHAMLFGSERVRCGGCGRPVTGERKVKKGAGVGTRGGGECGGVYDYYRCSRYNAPGHAGGRVRVSGRKLEQQVLEALRSLRITDDELAAVWRQNLVERAQWLQKDAGAQRDELQRQQRLVAGQKGRLLEAYLSGHVDKAALEKQSGKLKDREASLSLQLEGLGRAADEDAELAVKVFELSQSLHSQWKTADDAAKGVILELTCLNLELVGEKLVFSWRKPFDLVAKGLSVCSNRNGETAFELFAAGAGELKRSGLLMRLAG